MTARLVVGALLLLLIFGGYTAAVVVQDGWRVAAGMWVGLVVWVGLALVGFWVIGGIA